MTPSSQGLGSPTIPGRFTQHLPGFFGDLGSLIIFSIAVAAAAYLRRRAQTHKHLMLLAAMTLIPQANARIWLNSGLENALEFWVPLAENTIAVLVIGGAWLVRRRAPWVLIGGFIIWLVLYGVMFGLGTTDAARSWALAWMT